ncbi:MAG: amidohydrolase family protein [Myxococcales bacterium]
MRKSDAMHPAHHVNAKRLLFFASYVTLFWSVLGVIAAATAVTAAEEAPVYDVVIRGGRVIDAESGLDAVRNVGLIGGRIAEVSEQPLEGQAILPAEGLVVSAGFIDLHTHSPTPLGQHYQALDGVTTALELEVGAYPVAEFAPTVRGAALIHYGSSVAWASTRLEVKSGIRRPDLLSGKSEPLGLKGYWTAFRSLFVTPNEVFVEKASPREREKMRVLLNQGLDAGGLGIGVPLDYFSEGTDRDELRMVFSVASEREVPLFIHVRRGINGDPAGLREALELAKETGASVHICHIQHSAMKNVALFLAEIRVARAEGVDVTTETLPYNAGSALISSAVFGRDFRTIFAIDYGDVEWADTGERFDEATFLEYREKFPGGQVIHHYVQDEWTRTAIVEPGVIIVSDLLPMVTRESKVAPHNGSFSRVLGHYARDQKLLDLGTTLAKMTLLPALRLETAFPVFASKGRLRVGADADITVFNPTTLIDQATYQNPYQGSVGIEYVLVAGEVIVRSGEVVPDVYPGQLLSVPPAH